MKRSLIFMLLLSLTFSIPAYSQILKKVTNAMKDELLGTSNKTSKSQDPEPSSACSDAEQIVDLGGKYKLDYKELTITSMDDGSLLLQDRISGNYHILKGGVMSGPIQAGDPRIAGFENYDPGDTSKETMMKRYRGYISKSGDKYLITFNGKPYGPYGEIASFTVTKSKDKFAALVIETVVATENEGKKMDAAIANAKTDEEKMQLAMQYAQQMQQKIIQGGGPGAMTPKLVTNIPDATFSPVTGGSVNGNMKYDDILVSAYDKILDLHGNNIITLKQEHIGASEIFVSNDNSKYAITQYGTLILSNSNTPLTDLFNPRLIMSGASVYLAYMYYSPKKNAIMQCKIAF